MNKIILVGKWNVCKWSTKRIKETMLHCWCNISFIPSVELILIISKDIQRKQSVFEMHVQQFKRNHKSQQWWLSQTEHMKRSQHSFGTWLLYFFPLQVSECSVQVKWYQLRELKCYFPETDPRKSFPALHSVNSFVHTTNKHK